MFIKNHRQLMAGQNNPYVFQHEIGRRWRKRYLLSHISLLIGLMLGLALLASTARAMPNESGAGALYFDQQDGVYARPAMLLDSRVHFDINGLIVNAKLVQRFKNPEQHWLNAIYTFPLPSDAAIHAMTIRIGDRVIQGKIKEKIAAQKAYKAAMAAGKKASLLEQQRANLFSSRIANIGPDETIEVSIEYHQAVKYRDGLFSLNFPMTLTPRYMPGIEQGVADKEPQADDGDKSKGHSLLPGLGWAADTDQVSDASQISPFQTLNTRLDPKTQQAMINPIEISATLNAGLELVNIQSAYHQVLSHKLKDHVYDIRLRKARVSMDRDFELRWQLANNDVIQTAIFSEQVTGEDYAVVMLMPPQRLLQEQLQPRQVTFLIDVSGSMAGVSIQQAKQALTQAIESLRKDDKFELVAFNQAHTPLFSRARFATPENKRLARRFVRSLKADGGTEMAPALASAFNQPKHSGFIQQIVFITDGAVGNEKALLQQIQDDIGDRRLFTVGIGSAPNQHLFSKAAEIGRGSSVQISSEAEVSAKMENLFNKLANTVISHIQLSARGGENIEVYPQQIPDVFANEPILLALKLNGARHFQLQALSAQGPWTKDFDIQNVQDHKGVAKIWARKKIASLMMPRLDGMAPEQIKSAIIDTALSHQLMSAHTSFVAIESAPASRHINSNPAHNKTDVIANAVPTGQRLAYPRTANGTLASLLIGLGLLLSAIIIAISKPKSDSFPV